MIEVFHTTDVRIYINTNTNLCLYKFSDVVVDGRGMSDQVTPHKGGEFQVEVRRTRWSPWTKRSTSKLHQLVQTSPSTKKIINKNRRTNKISIITHSGVFPKFLLGFDGPTLLTSFLFESQFTRKLEKRRRRKTTRKRLPSSHRCWRKEGFRKETETSLWTSALNR